jgi:hypothetical protein
MAIRAVGGQVFREVVCVRYRLRNQREADRVLSLTASAWFSLLELGEAYGWIPMAAVLPGFWSALEPPELGYDLQEPGDGAFRRKDERRLVVLEDALNLADALERAFIAYDPPPSDRYTYLPLAGRILSTPSIDAGIGVLLELIDFCQLGAFWIESYS